MSCARFWFWMCTTVLLHADAWARLPVPYELQGTIQSIDSQSHRIVLDVPKPKFRIAKTLKPNTFIWTERTEIVRNGHPVEPTELVHGQNVKLYYRYSQTNDVPYVLRLGLEKPDSRR